ncbi:hypothetical protein ROA7450_00002 [Roseovarius albus]|uniref:Uncharacterized protein n=1 Tax=Roseovarius albus TaxID=1247867 RepID=A0A1X6Y4L9_9RHOB|nr:hypothetical protein [Roseovarius albus]SLN10198.1 hypothetical protein ROA7450_00002 [Roseovarius albus]
MKNLIVSCTVFMLGSAAWAGGNYTGNGVGSGTSTTTPHPVADNHVVLQTSSSYDKMQMEDASHPLHGGAGPCFGAVEMSAAKVAGHGMCLFTDAGGDVMVLHWHATGQDDSGALVGDWEISSGTGKWNGATGGGQFASKTDPNTGAFVNQITSDITLP